MDSKFDFQKVLKKGELEDQQEYEIAKIAAQKIGQLAEQDAELKPIHQKLQEFIQAFEAKHQQAEVPQKYPAPPKTEEEGEEPFIQKRKTLIRKQLQKHGLNQQEFGLLLGHGSKSYISELMNGVVPFSLKDLVIIHRLFGIKLADLVPTTLSSEEELQVLAVAKQLGKTKLKFNK